jgi:hypothetical protein
LTASDGLIDDDDLMGWVVLGCEIRTFFVMEPIVSFRIIREKKRGRTLPHALLTVITLLVVFYFILSVKNTLITVSVFVFVL